MLRRLSGLLVLALALTACLSTTTEGGLTDGGAVPHEWPFQVTQTLARPQSLLDGGHDPGDLTLVLWDLSVSGCMNVDSRPGHRVTVHLVRDGGVNPGSYSVGAGEVSATFSEGTLQPITWQAESGSVRLDAIGDAGSAFVGASGNFDLAMAFTDGGSAFRMASDFTTNCP